MAERWRKPAVVLELDHTVEQGVWLPDGRVQSDVGFVFDPETVERMRLGYLCCKCMEPFETAWPERCPVCGCPVRTEQAEFFAREFGGVEKLGPSEPLFDGGIHERAAEAEETP